MIIFLFLALIMIAKVNPMNNKCEIVKYKIMWEGYYAYVNVSKSFNEVFYVY